MVKNLKIYKDFNISSKFNNSIILIGNFDGLHIGHQKLFKIARKYKLRKKLKLKTIQEPKTNFSNKYFYEIENYLKQKKIKFKKIKTSYKKTYKKDIFFKYFMQDRKFMNKMGMEEKNQLKNRLEVFLIQQ